MAGTNNPSRGRGLLGLKGTVSKIEGLLEEPGEGARRWRAGKEERWKILAGQKLTKSVGPAGEG